MTLKHEKTRMADPVNFSRWIACLPTTPAMLPAACAVAKHDGSGRFAFIKAEGCVAEKRTGSFPRLKELYRWKAPSARREPRDGQGLVQPDLAIDPPRRQRRASAAVVRPDSDPAVL